MTPPTTIRVRGATPEASFVGLTGPANGIVIPLRPLELSGNEARIALGVVSHTEFTAAPGLQDHEIQHVIDLYRRDVENTVTTAGAVGRAERQRLTHDQQQAWDAGMNQSWRYVHDVLRFAAAPLNVRLQLHTPIQETIADTNCDGWTDPPSGVVQLDINHFISGDRLNSVRFTASAVHELVHQQSARWVHITEPGKYELRGFGWLRKDPLTNELNRFQLLNEGGPTGVEERFLTDARRTGTWESGSERHFQGRGDREKADLQEVAKEIKLASGSIAVHQKDNLIIVIPNKSIAHYRNGYQPKYEGLISLLSEQYPDAGTQFARSAAIRSFIAGNISREFQDAFLARLAATHGPSVVRLLEILPVTVGNPANESDAVMHLYAQAGAVRDAVRRMELRNRLVTIADRLHQRYGFDW